MNIYLKIGKEKGLNDLELFKEPLKDIVWMARRYAENRKSYAPSLFNMAYEYFEKCFGVEFEGKKDPVLEKQPYLDEEFDLRMEIVRNSFKSAIVNKVDLPNGNTVLVEVGKEFLESL